MDLHLFLRDFLKKQSALGEDLGCFLSGCRALYLLSQSEEERMLLLDAVKTLVEREGRGALPDDAALLPGRSYFFLYDETGDERHREAIEASMTRLLHCPRMPDGVFGRGGGDSSPMPWKIRCQAYPFYTEYETRYHGKANYQDIARQLVALQPDTGAWDPADAWYLMTLVGVLDCMSIEIYEHYRTLEDAFRATVHAILRGGWEEGLSEMDRYRVGYSVAAACLMGILNSEKYAGIGLSLLDGAERRLNSGDPEMIGIAMLSAAARLALKSKQEVQRVG